MKSSPPDLLLPRTVSMLSKYDFFSLKETITAVKSGDKATNNPTLDEYVILRALFSKIK